MTRKLNYPNSALSDSLKLTDDYSAFADIMQAWTYAHWLSRRLCYNHTMEKALVSGREKLDVSVEPLGEADLEWLSLLANRPVDADELANVNANNMLASKGLKDQIDDEVIDARKEFYDKFLGWDNEEHPLHNSYCTFVQLTNGRVNSPLTMIGSLRHLYNSGIHVVKLLNKFPAAISYSQEGVVAKLDNFEQLGIDGVKLVNHHPAAIGYNKESMLAKLDNFEQLGIDGVKLVNRLPAAIGLNQESVAAKLDNFERLGIDGVKLVNRLPAAISLNQEAIALKIQLLWRMGAIQEHPGLLRDTKNVAYILITPIESLMAVADSADIDRPHQIYNQAIQFMKNQGANSAPERKEYIKQHRIELAQNLGWTAIATMSYGGTLGDSEEFFTELNKSLPSIKSTWLFRPSVLYWEYKLTV